MKNHSERVKKAFLNFLNFFVRLVDVLHFSIFDSNFHPKFLVRMYLDATLKEYAQRLCLVDRRHLTYASHARPACCVTEIERGA